jgi:hypothetical protein
MPGRVAAQYRVFRGTPLINVRNKSTAEVGYNVMKGADYFESLESSVVITEYCNIWVMSEGLIRTTEYLAI